MSQRASVLISEGFTFYSETVAALLTFVLKVPD